MLLSRPTYASIFQRDGTDHCRCTNHWENDASNNAYVGRERLVICCQVEGGIASENWYVEMQQQQHQTIWDALVDDLSSSGRAINKFLLINNDLVCAPLATNRPILKNLSKVREGSDGRDIG